MRKSSIDQIRARFDADVERFSNLQTGQTSTMDAALAMELVTHAAAVATPNPKSVLDIGCGAGNYTLRLLQQAGSFDATLVDISIPMLERAHDRMMEAGAKSAVTIQRDARELDFAEESFDVILAASVLHHLRSEEEFERLFRNIFAWLRPGGSFWIFDLLTHEIGAVGARMWERYGHYLESLGGQEYRDKVFAYIEEEDTPLPLTTQLEALRRVGFSQIDVLHKNGPFAAFGGMRV